MGLLDLFAKEITCPTCGTSPARKTLWIVRCPHRGCEHFDPAWRDTLAEHGRHARVREEPRKAPARAEREVVLPASPPPVALFEPDDFLVAIDYVNHAGDRKTFTGDVRTLRRRGAHVSMRVMPRGLRIALALSRIQNVEDVEGWLREFPEPKPDERSVLGYHLRHEHPSPVREGLREKYPHFDTRLV